MDAQAPPPSEPAHPVGDLHARRRFITRSIVWTVPGTLLGVAAAYALTPPLPGMADAGDRVLLALRWLAIALLPFVVNCLAIALLRLVEGAHDPLAGQESTRLRIHGRVLQNTLEQLVWFAIALLALAPALAPHQARLIPVLCVAFAAARIVYWRGYLRHGTLGRAPGVQITLTLNVATLVAAFAFLVRDGLR